MRLDDLVTALGAAGAPRLDGVPTTEVTRVDHDSRAVVPGSLFACLRGANADGHDFAPAAVAGGATALLVDHPLGLGVAEVRVDDTRRALGPLAARIVGDPSRSLSVVGVTGTNGKTTVVHLLGAVADAAGGGGATVGTLTGARTTPEAPDLQRQLRTFLDEGRRFVAMEVSSHALALHRVDGTRFRVAVFTNLSQDHLDFHGDMPSYFAAKARLFTAELADRAVVNVDDPWGAELARHTEIPVTEVRCDHVDELELGPAQVRFRWRDRPVTVPLGGRFNAGNALLAAEAAVAAGFTPDEVVAGLAAAPPAPGRFEPVDAGQPFAVIVDYAHTPDGLARVLDAVREHTTGRVTVVFGCGGDRDADKRPQMGAVAASRADRVVITDDNPRHEDPEAIVAAILGGIAERGHVEVVRDRRAAIALAVGAAREHDTVLIAGKGHETTQTTGDRVVPFDDRAVARAALVEAGYGDDRR